MTKVNTSNMIFVFGSNLLGIHGAGAARFAREQRGAMMGHGVGRTGQSYALPTKARPDGGPLPLEEIKAYVDEFIAHAKDRRHLQFQVTCVGCGLAGLRHEDIAPMFIECSKYLTPNLWFDNVWAHHFAATGEMSMAGYNFWGTF